MSNRTLRSLGGGSTNQRNSDAMRESSRYPMSHAIEYHSGDLRSTLMRTWQIKIIVMRLHPFGGEVQNWRTRRESNPKPSDP